MLERQLLVARSVHKAAIFNGEDLTRGFVGTFKETQQIRAWFDFSSTSETDRFCLRNLAKFASIINSRARFANDAASESLP